VVALENPRPLTLAEGLAVDPDSRTSRWRPGTFYSYSNAGPPVAAAVVEKLTGKRFEDYVRETFFDRIGMPTADYFYPERTRGLLTNLYHRDGRTPYPYRHHPLRPSGALNASAREMGAYLRFLLRRGETDAGRILAEKSIQRMETSVSSYGAKAGLPGAYGLANFARPDRRGFWWRGHDGMREGARAHLSYRDDQVACRATRQQAIWKNNTSGESRPSQRGGAHGPLHQRQGNPDLEHHHDGWRRGRGQDRRLGSGRPERGP
jgi:hypothetical protein